jgi:tetratricopeptide (TPR) repeat protein
MPEQDSPNSPADADSIFERAEKAAKANELDAAIDLYIEALRLVPEEVDRGHVKLREIAARRHTVGGKKPTPEEIEAHSRGTTPLEQMLDAEYLLAKNPGRLSYGEAVLKAAVAGGYKAAARWMADLMFLANNRAKKPSLVLYTLLKDSYAAIGQYERAAAACKRAIKFKPDDLRLAGELRELTEKAAAGKVPAPSPDDDGLADEVTIEPLVATADSSDLMGEPKVDPVIAKAKGFFQKARKVAETENYDYAIDLYLDGLRWTPDALEQGHLPLCELALKRQKKGGKKPSAFEKVKRLRGKTYLDQMINAEYLFARDPDNLQYAAAMMKAAVAGEFNKTADWIANYTFQANNASDKPSLQIYVQLKDAYRELGHFDKALAACQHAVRLKPKDEDLAEQLKNLTAEMTVSRGRYDQEGDFRKAIKDRDAQEKLHASRNVIKTEDYRVTAVKDARKSFQEEPNLPANIFTLAEALADLDDDKSHDEAVGLLEKTYQDRKDFSFKQKAGELKIRRLKQKIRDAKETLEKTPEDAGSKAKADKLSAELNRVELDHYKLCVQNYPTDLRAKYEYGVRLVRNEQYDEAIPLFQEAQRDPRHRVSATDKIGMCFFKKGWFTDAIDVFAQALDSYEVKDDSIAKEIRYNLARAYEEDGNDEKALEMYRKLAQLDFAFKDVRQRVGRLRKKGNS